MMLLATLYLLSAPSVPMGGVNGEITDQHRAPVPGVEVRLAPAASSAGVTYSIVSDSAGRYVWRQVVAGTYRLTARRLGFEPVDVSIVVRDGEDLEENIRMTAVAQRLDTVSVVGQSLTPARYGTSSRLDEFFRRKNEGRGHYFTRDQIDSTDANSTATLLGRVPGIRSKREADGTIYVRIASCLGNNGRLSPGPGNDWGWEHVELFIDGVEVGKGSRLPSSAHSSQRTSMRWRSTKARAKSRSRPSATPVRLCMSGLGAATSPTRP